MKKTGKVLRDPRAGPGLLMVEGRQYPFFIHPMWKSEAPPTPGLTVNIDFSDSGQIVAITTLPESQRDDDRPSDRTTRKFLEKLAACCGLAR